MKFRIRVDGKDSISEGLSDAVTEKLEAAGVKFDPANSDAWDDKHEREFMKLQRFVQKFVEDGSGGSDAVTVEFDTDAGTCTVVTVKEARKKK